MEYVYGPVPSRRLGQSLGIDPIPLKTCNWNCVYCQLGRTIPLANQRKEYVPRQQIIAEVEKALQEAPEGSIDWITFVGSGEPTLHSSLGWMIREVKKHTEIPVAVITNGSLFYLPEVRRALHPADAVLPSFDAGRHGLYRKINRPHPEISFDRLFDGLVSFSREYRGKIGVEVMLVQGLNDTEKALQEIARKIKAVDLDEVHLAQPTRPPVETWVQPPTEEGLMRAQAILGEAAHVLHPAVGTFNLGEYESLTDALVGIITRHPLKEKQILDILQDWSPDAVNRELADLHDSGKAQVVERYGVKFWIGSPSYFPGVE